MKNTILLLTFLILSIKGFSTETNDTIKVSIDLRQVDSLGMKIEVFTPSDLKGNTTYQFPKSVPGIYEYLKNSESYLKLYQAGQEVIGIKGSYKINCDCELPVKFLVQSTKNSYGGIYAKDFHYIKDSIYIMNWHYLIGFFQNETNRPYKIEVVKNKRLYGAGSLSKKELNDSIDLYTANNYKELIHSPILYSMPDTTSFKIGKTKFVISCSGNDTILNSKKIEELIIKPLSDIVGKSNYKHKEYFFLFFSEYSVTSPYLRGLEHPNSTFISYHPALLDKEILTSCSIHEYIHSIFAPLRIRSEVIKDFDFITPQCDEFLWFYEGVTEYLTLKTLIQSGFFSYQEFLDELSLSNRVQMNINLSKVSSNAYGEKEQQLFDDFYTKGSLFAFNMDVEIIKKSNGETDLLGIMQQLQKRYSPDIPFDSKNFINEFSTLSGIDLQDLIVKNTNSKKKVDFLKLCDEIGFVEEQIDTVKWSFGIKKAYMMLHHKEEKMELLIQGSKINNVTSSKKVTVSAINGDAFTWYNDYLLRNPKDGQEVSFTISTKSGKSEIKAKPDAVERKYSIWKKNSNYDTELAKKFWNE